jgi:hypothetical protein
MNRRDLEVQFIRMAQLQAEVDALKSGLKPGCLSGVGTQLPLVAVVEPVFDCTAAFSADT